MSNQAPNELPYKSQTLLRMCFYQLNLSEMCKT